jgi:hypothetical protein
MGTATSGRELGVQKAAATARSGGAGSSGLHRGTLHVESLAEHKLPKRVVEMVGEWAQKTEVTGALWRHRQAVQGSYTHKLKARDARALRMETTVKPGTDEQYGRDCPLEGCGEGHCKFRRVQMECKGAGIGNKVAHLSTFVEATLKKHKTTGGTASGS